VTPAEPAFLTLAEVVEIHRDQIERHGGRGGTRDIGLLESALAAPAASAGGEYAHQDLFAMAAAYAFHIVKNHPFVDGNKRTGLVSALVFLELNGVSVLDPEGRLYEAVTKLAAGESGREQFAALLRALPHE
jgi:death-on-curing protein